MIERIQEIWKPDARGPTVGQETAKTRVGVVTFADEARIVASLNQLNSNADLINTLSGLNQTTSSSFDGAK